MIDGGPSSITLSPRELVAANLPNSASQKATPKEAARQFEGLLMAQLFQSLRKTVEPSGLFGNEGQARQTYEYLFDQAIVEQAMSGGRGWGLAERLEKSWTQVGKNDSQPIDHKRDLKDSSGMPIDQLSR